MSKLRSVFGLLCFVLLCSSAATVSGQRSRGSRSRWQTFNGTQPLVIARGGFSGLFPDSSSYAYSLALQLGLPNTLLWCDVQLTRNGDGICSPNINLQNASLIDLRYPNGSRTYPVNNVPTTGWFSSDFTTSQLQSVELKQGIYSRAPNYDNSLQTFLNVTEVFNPPQEPLPTGLWLSVPHDQFFRQRNLNMARYILSISRSVIITYISSPEVGFLRSVASLRGTKRVFQVLGRDAVEPTINSTYDTLLGNLTFIRTFADGILVPKSYIWPVDNTQYLQNYTSLVLDAHNAGLEVFASGFANDVATAYDYNYDPVSEYLSYIDNGQFSVDGVVSDYPVTPSATIDCYAHMARNAPSLANITIITNEGASGEYPGCTDIAYRQAVSDGADFIDCPVQMTSDGIAICLGSINLRDRTSVATSIYSNRTTDNSALNIRQGIFAYSLTWEELQGLSPAMYNPFGGNYSLFRNPRARNEGNFTRLSGFLEYARNQSSISGVVISIENAAYLAAEQGLGVTDAVLNALGEAGYNQTASKKVLIKSSDSSVLKTLKSRSSYELVYVVGEDVRDIPSPIITEIRQFANSVFISKPSVFPTDAAFVVGETEVVSKLHSFNLSVYVQYFRNEFVTQPWDFFSDPYVEMNTYFLAKGIDGVITDFPATAARYRRNRCIGYPADRTPFYASPIQPRGLLPFMSPSSFPPAEAPNPILTEGDVTEPPLPPVAERPPPGNPPAAPGPTPPSGQPTLVASTFLNGIAILLLLATFVL